MITAIVQARVGSSRLPGKTLMPFGNHNVLGYMINRIKRSKSLQQIVVATTEEQQDDAISKFCEQYEISCFRGSSNDVLERYFGAAKIFGASHIVRLTADDPFKTASIIDKAISKYLSDTLHYCSNTIEPTYPEGLDVEVFSYSALQLAYENEGNLFEREHVTPYIWKNADNKFKIGQIYSDIDRSKWRMTIDYPEDYKALAFLQSNVAIDADYCDIVNAIQTLQITDIMSPLKKRNEAYNAKQN